MIPNRGGNKVIERDYILFPIEVIFQTLFSKSASQRAESD